MAQQRFVYILRSRNHPQRFYTGRTSDIKRRLASHNAGECTATAKYRPWDLDVVIAFRDEQRALALEQYLKSGSGCAFAQRHLRPILTVDEHPPADGTGSLHSGPRRSG